MSPLLFLIQSFIIIIINNMKSCKIDELRTFLGVDKATDPRKKPDLAMQAYEEEKAMLNGYKFGFDIENRKYFTNRFVN